MDRQVPADKSVHPNTRFQLQRKGVVREARWLHDVLGKPVHPCVPWQLGTVRPFVEFGKGKQGNPGQIGVDFGCYFRTGCRASVTIDGGLRFHSPRVRHVQKEIEQRKGLLLLLLLLLLGIAHGGESTA